MAEIVVHFATQASENYIFVRGYLKVTRITGPTGLMELNYEQNDPGSQSVRVAQFNQNAINVAKVMETMPSRGRQ